MPIVLEADEATIEEVIDRRSEEKAILAVQPLLVGGIPPWLAMTCHEVRGVFDAGDPTSAFDPRHAITEQPLPTPRPNEREPIGLGNARVFLDPALDLHFPGIQIIGGNRLDRCAGRTNGIHLPADQPEENLGEQFRDFSQIDRLQAIAVSLERRVLGRQQRP